jgi:AcrR family transcriptional regulator
MGRREQLLEEALRLFTEKSGRDASMRELARRAGIDVRTTYYYFPSKADLLRELVALGGHLDPPPPGALDTLRAMEPPAALHAIIRLVLDLLTERAPYNRLLNTQVLAGDDDARAVAQELWDRWQEQLEALLEAGRIATGAALAPYARMMRTLLWGVFSESHLTGALADDDARDARAAELAAVLMRTADSRAR